MILIAVETSATPITFYEMLAGKAAFPGRQFSQDWTVSSSEAIAEVSTYGIWHSY
jgi:hypothetical protein